jgi:uncharacterized phage protein (TIGR02220 family)
MTDGYIKLHRKIEDDELWLTEPFTKSQAWIDLILGANRMPGKVMIRDMSIELDTGQLAWSQLTMCKRWKWSRGKVKRYLNLLQKIERILVQPIGQHSTLLTICNYKKYQVGRTTGETKTVPEAGHKQESIVLGSIENNIKNNIISPTTLSFCEEVIADINQTWGKKYHVETYEKKITALQKKGYTLEDFKEVHRKMKKLWENNPKMNRYLRPKTLYVPENFDSYVNENDSVPDTPLKPTRANLDQRNRNTADEIRRKYLGRQHPSNSDKPSGDVRQLPAGSDRGNDGNVVSGASRPYSQPDCSSDTANNQISFL